MKRSTPCLHGRSGLKGSLAVDSLAHSGIAYSAALQNSMLYALICTDKPNSLAIRKANRPEHVAYLKSLGDTVVLAGPSPSLTAKP